MVLFYPKYRWYMNASNLPCANCITFRRFWHVQNPTAGCGFDWYHAGLTPQIMCSKHRWYMTKVNVPCAKFGTFCDRHVISYTNSVFKRGTILVVLRVYLTLLTRLHRIFESVPKRWISSSFVVIFNSICWWYMDASNLSCVNCITFRWFWHVLCPVGSIACYRA